MKIGIEARNILQPIKRGMDYVALEVIKHLQKMDITNEYYIFVRSGRDRCLSDSMHVHIIEVNCPTDILWMQYALPKVAKKMGVDILHCTQDDAPLFCSIPIILTLHDILFMEEEKDDSWSIKQKIKWYYKRYVTQRVVGKCQKVLTVSHYEYNNIQNYFHLGDRMGMIYNGYSEWFKPTEDKIEEIYRRYIPEKGYLFFMGSCKEEKNVSNTLIAYSKYLKRSKVKRQLIVSNFSQTDLEDIIEKHNIDNIKEYVVTPGYIVERDLPYIFSGAFAFLYTSLYESFGTPLLESMACGTPVITSNTASMPEIAGSDAILIDPHNPDAIVDAIINLEENEDAYKYQVQYGLERSKPFTWDNTASELLDLYREVVKKL